MLGEAFAALLPHLDERQRRLALGAAARVLGYGGVRRVARVARVAAPTVARGARALGGEPAARVRAAGAGRPRPRDRDPGLVPALLALVEPDQRGDPESPLRWTVKSTRKLAAELTRQGHPLGADTVAALLKAEGFSLQGTSRTTEGARHPDRDAQFRYINGQVKEFTAAGQPVISVDTKKKEVLGEYAAAGQDWHRAGQPVRVRAHDFPEKGAQKAVPYGIYDLAADAGWVSVGCDGDTAAFAVATLRRWWNGEGRHRYPAADHRRRGWRERLPGAGLEAGTGRLRPRQRAPGNGVSLSAGHLEVEQDRAPAVLPDQQQLARPPADQSRGRRRHDRRHHHPHRAHRPLRTRPRCLPHRRHDPRPGHGGPAADRPRLARHVELHPATRAAGTAADAAL